MLSNPTVGRSRLSTLAGAAHHRERLDAAHRPRWSHRGRAAPNAPQRRPHAARPALDPGSMRRQNHRHQRLLPADKHPGLPLTASNASTSTNACVSRSAGSKCMLTATSVWKTREAAFNAGYLRAALRSTRCRQSRNSVRTPGQRRRSAGNTTDAPTSPPMASARLNLLRHERPGNLILAARSRRALEAAAEGGARRNANGASPPGRDNSVSPSRNNLLTALFRDRPPVLPGSRKNR